MSESPQAQCITNLGNVLNATGSSWEKVVEVNVYLKNMDDFAAMNEVYGKVSSLLYSGCGANFTRSNSCFPARSQHEPAFKLPDFQTMLMLR